MGKEVEIFALIPAYKPGDMLINLARQMYEAGLRVVIVDDGSGSGYESVFSKTEPYATVLSYSENHGKGYALKTGLSYIAEQKLTYCVIVTLDADGQHRLEDVLRVKDEALKNKDSFVLGSRRLRENTPARSQFGNTITRFVFRLSTGKKIHDTQTGLRAFGSDMIPFLCGIEGDRYEFEMNVLLMCAKHDIPIHEIEIETIYFDNNAGSHFNTISDSYRVYGEILKFAASSFTGFLVDYGMYSLLVILTAGLGTAVSVPLSNICARVTSATVNYYINRRFIFKNRDRVAKTATLYFTLAACILAFNTLLLGFLVEKLYINKFFAKIITEITFFTLSWLVQRFIIFRKHKRN